MLDLLAIVPWINFLSLLYIALTLALFQSLGKVLVSRDFLNITVRGVAMATANSLRYLGWIWSGPGDLSIFSLLISVVTYVSVIINGGILCSISLGGINGISPSGSFANILALLFAFIYFWVLPLWHQLLRAKSWILLLSPRFVYF